MGVSLLTLSTSSSEDNISLGDKDSIHRHALWALEGKSSPDGFSPVEIPEPNTPEIERRISTPYGHLLHLPLFRFELTEEHRRRVGLLTLNVPTPIVPPRRMMSIDSLCSATDVESFRVGRHTLTGHELKVMQEVDEDEEPCSDRENNLIGYEDEDSEVGDESFTSYDKLSFSPLGDIPRSTAHLLPVPSSSSSPSRTRESRDTHIHPA